MDDDGDIPFQSNMYTVENMVTKEKYKGMTKLEVCRLTGLSGNYIDNLAKWGKISKKGWKVTRLKW